MYRWEMKIEGKMNVYITNEKPMKVLKHGSDMITLAFQKNKYLENGLKRQALKVNRVS